MNRRQSQFLDVLLIYPTSPLNLPYKLSPSSWVPYHLTPFDL